MVVTTKVLVVIEEFGKQKRRSKFVDLPVGNLVIGFEKLRMLFSRLNNAQLCGV